MAKLTVRVAGTIDLGDGRWLVNFVGAEGDPAAGNVTFRFATSDLKFVDSLVPGDLFAVEMTTIRDVDPAPH